MRYMLIVLMAMLTACSPGADLRGEALTAEPTEAPEASGLAGTSWVLVEIMWGPPIQGTTITLDFAESTISGQACSSYSADYGASPKRMSYGDGLISIGGVEPTAMDCGESEDEQESSYFNILDKMRAYRVTSDGLLILENPGMDPCCLIFAPAGEGAAPVNIVDGTSWVVTEMNGEPLLEGTQITASFDAQQITGYTGCNQYYAPYTLGNIWNPESKVGPVTITEAGCGELKEQQALFLQVLRSVEHISRYGDGELTMSGGGFSLILRDPDNPPPVSELAGTAWILISLNGERPLEGTQLALTFGEGTVSGFGGCNTFGSNSWEEANQGLYIEGAGQTMVQCSEPAGVMEQESAYYDSLTRITRYRLIDSSTLELSGDDGTLLMFEPAPQYSLNPAELVGTKWVLRTINGAEPDLAYPAPTIEFVEQRTISQYIENIRISGFAGCRNFEVSFNFMDDTLNFNEPKLPSEPCENGDALEFEGDFLALLGSTTAYLLDGDTLDLIGRNGNVLGFERLSADDQ